MSKKEIKLLLRGETKWFTIALSAILLSNIVFLAIAALFAFTSITRPSPTFTYGTLKTNEGLTFCEGGNLVFTLEDGQTEGLANITMVAHTIYYSNTSDIAKMLSAPELIAGGEFGQQGFDLTLVIETSDLPIGQYIYTRQAIQLPDSNITGIDIPFEIKECE